MTELELILTQNDYVRDILNGPLAIRNSIDTWVHEEQLAIITERIHSFNYKKIILTGMGSSFHALYPLYLRLIQHCIPVYHIETSELIYYSTELLTDDCLTIIVSQSGESIEIKKLLCENHNRGLIVGITNTEQSTLSAKTDCLFLTHAGIEKSVSCKTYMTALAAITLLGDILLEENTSNTIKDLGIAATAIQNYLANIENHVSKLIDLFFEIKYLIVTGRGMSLASAHVSGLIIKEASHFFAEGMSSAAFRHGPFEIVLSDLFLMVFSGDQAVCELNKKLVNDVQSCGGKAVIVKQGKECNPFVIPVVPDSILPIVEMLPAQMLSIALSIIHEHEPGKFDLISKVTLNE